MQHLDEAHKRAETCLAEWLKNKPKNWRVLLVKDVRAMLRMILWCSDPEWKSSHDEINRRLDDVASHYWSKSILRGRRRGHPDYNWQEEAWRKARNHEETDRLRILDRYLVKTGWFDAPVEPPWKVWDRNAPAITVFYSFKGGVGRSTALAATALHLAASGERVVVLDADLDAPGVGSLLAAHDGATASWGIVDYLLERRIQGEGNPLPIADYYHRYPTGSIAGEILVFPAGAFDEHYVDKLARIDYGTPSTSSVHPLVSLLNHTRQDLAPGWILVDARAGLGDVSGFLTGGLCHFHVLLGTLADASWRGLERVLERLGGDRVREGKTQAECLLVASMVPWFDDELFKTLVERFTDRARDVFSECYYADPAESESPDDFWTLNDVESTDAPHVPVVLPYNERLATFRDLNEVAKPILLRDGEPYQDLAGRLRVGAGRFRRRGR